MQRYTLASCKGILGQIRGKYAVLPSPGGGSQLNGEANGDFFGFSTALSGDGTVLAVSAPLNEGNENSDKIHYYAGTWTTDINKARTPIKKIVGADGLDC